MNNMKFSFFFFFLFTTVFAESNTDWRNIINAVSIIPDENYCDQPYVVKAKNGDWVSIITTGSGSESQQGQHIVASISKDKGNTWSPLIDIESSKDPASSWGIPYITPFGRIYVFYTFNGDTINTLMDKPLKHNSELGWYCFKYSDDNGWNWSQRYRIPMRKTTIDYINPWNGDVQLFWGISKPFSMNGSMYFAFTKMAIHPQDMGEGFLYKSKNINVEKDPNKIQWEMLPEGDKGISSTALGETQEEHNIVPLNNGDFYCIYRTTEGYPADCYSKDKGKTWSTPKFATYADGRVIKNPRACPRVFKASNGKYILWYHNNNMKGYKGLRNPAWVSGGIEKNGKIMWSEPEVLLYGDEGQMMSYPDMIEENGQFWITETQKEIARVHKIDPKLFEDMWRQGLDRSISRKGVVFERKNIDTKEEVDFSSFPSLETNGLSIDLWLETKEWIPNEIILDNRDEKGNGLKISVTAKRTIQVCIQDNGKSCEWDTDPGVVKGGKPQHVVFVIDEASDLITSVVNGKLCDGGRYRFLGWTRFDKQINNINGSYRLRILPDFSGKIRSLRIYNRYLTTSEAISNFKAGIQR